jgi:hypothetical protein
MNKIDWNKPYAEVIGFIDDKPGAKYRQGDKYYRVNGDLISQAENIDKSWVESQKGLVGRNNLINKAKSLGLEILKTDSIVELKEKLISRL